jgi:hypothetical protein
MRSETNTDFVLIGEPSEFRSAQINVRGVFEGARQALESVMADTLLSIRDTDRGISSDKDKKAGFAEAVVFEDGKGANNFEQGIRQTLKREIFNKSMFEGMDWIKGTTLDPYYRGQDGIWDDEVRKIEKGKVASPIENGKVRLKSNVNNLTREKIFDIVNSHVPMQEGSEEIVKNAVDKIWDHVERSQGVKGADGKDIFVYNISGLQGKPEEEKYAAQMIQDHVDAGEKVVVIFTRFDAGLNTLKMNGKEYKANIRMVGDLMDKVSMEQLIGRGTWNGDKDSKRAILEDGKLQVYLDGSRLEETQREALMAAQNLIDETAPDQKELKAKTLSETVYKLADLQSKTIGEEAGRQMRDIMLGLQLEGAKGKATYLPQVTEKYKEDVKRQLRAQYSFISGADFSGISETAQPDLSERPVLSEDVKNAMAAFPELKQLAEGLLRYDHRACFHGSHKKWMGRCYADTQQGISY